MSSYLNPAIAIVDENGRPTQHFIKYLEAMQLTTWDDLKSPATGVNPPGQASDPAWDTANPGWLFDATSTEILHIIEQFPHRWKQGSEIRPHVHWQKTTSAAGDVMWQLEYSWVSIGEVPASYVTISQTSVVDGTPDTNTADKHLISAFPHIDATGRGISDMLIMKLSRIGGNADDTYGADARLLEFDIHVQLTTLSSVHEFKK